MRTCLMLHVICVFTFVESAADVGEQIADFKLQDSQGGWHALGDWADRKAVVVAFIGAECPLAQQYAPRLVQLAQEYEPQGVAFVAIDSNPHDSLEEIAQYARTHKIAFPVLKDPGNKVADQFTAARTPEVFLLDGERAVRYRGRIDDQFGVGYARAKPTRRDLAIAIDELLAGKPITMPKTGAVGCHIGRVARKPPQGDITYAKHIAPILQNRCIGCHRPGQVGPFALTDYDEVVGWAETIREAVNEQRMPPWHANPAYGRFFNDSRLSADEKRLINEWVSNGAPEGDEADLPPPPKFADEWAIPRPDLIVTMPEPFTVPAKGTVPYKFFRTDVSFDEDRWMIASEGRPGNRAVVHHMLLFYIPPGTKQISPEMPFFNVLGAYVPGLPTGVLPSGIARRIPAGSTLAFQMHYTPNGTEQSDQSSCGLVFIDPKKVKKSLQVGMALNFLFRIPPGAKDYRLEASHHFGEDTLLYTLQPHMHLRGKSFLFEAIYPDGRKETLLDVPRYDFNWQLTYALAKPKLLPEGTTLHCTAVYDNSAENRVNPNPASAVTWGDQTWDEMMIGAFDTVSAEQDLTLGPPQVTARGDRFDVVFRYRPTSEAHEVYLAGSFTDWQPTGHKMDGPDREGRYSTTLHLKPGRYEYKFVIDGERWRTDPGNPVEAGRNRNSVVWVGGEAPKPPALSKVVPAEDLIAQVEIFRKSLHEMSADEQTWEGSAHKVARDAQTLAAVALTLALYDREHSLKSAAPAVVDAARELGQAKKYPAVQNALRSLETALDEPPAAAQPVMPQLVGSMGQLMKQASFTNNRIKRGLGRIADGKDEKARDSAVLAAIAQTMMYDTREIHGDDQLEQWYRFCGQMRDRAGQLNAAIRAADKEGAERTLEELGKSCNACHAAFRKTK